MENIKINTEEAKMFLSEMFNNKTQGYIEFRLIATGKQGKVEQKYYESLDEINWKNIEQKNQQGYNIYYGVGIRKICNGTKKDILQIPAIWVDLDSKDFAGDKSNILKVYKEKLPEKLHPTHIVDSGNGYHLYWLLQKPEEINNADDITRIESYTSGLAEYLGGDHTQDVSRVLRLAGTINVKNPDNPKPCKLVNRNGKQALTLSDFDSYRKNIVAGKSMDVHFDDANIKIIDIKQIGISSKMQQLIIDGWTEGSEYKSHSETDQAVIIALLGAGHNDDTIRAVFSNPEWKIGNKYRISGDKYLAHSVSNGKAYLFAKKPQAETTTATKPVALSEEDLESFNNINRDCDHEIKGDMNNYLYERMANRCEFIKYCQDKPKEIAEPLLYAVISNLSKYENGEWAILNFARGNIELSENRLEAIIKYATKNIFPATCNYIRQNGFKGCPEAGCGVRCPAGLSRAWIHIEEKRYWKEKDKNNKTVEYPISNFVIIPRERIRMIETREEHVKADIIYNTTGEMTGFSFGPDTWISKQKFKQALKGRLELLYKGTDDDLQDIKRILTFYNIPIKQATKTLGFHKVEGEWVFVCNDGAIDKSGSRTDLVFHQEEARIRCHLLKAESLTHTDLENITKILFEINDPSVIIPLFGWCFACFFKERIFHILKQFPILIVHGPAGSGKTSTFQNVILPLFGLPEHIDNIGMQTKFTFMRDIASSNTIPKVYDEHKLSKLPERQRNIISELIRSIFNNQSGSRGTADQRQIEYFYTAPVAILGEQGTIEVAHRDRIIDTFWSKEKRKTKPEYTINFEKLKKLNLSGLGKDILIWSLQQDNKLLEETFVEELRKVSDQLEDRIKQNTAYVRFGLRMYGMYLEQNGINMDIASKLELADQIQLENLGDKDNHKSVVDEIMEQIIIIISQANVGDYYLQKAFDYEISKNGLLRLDVNLAYPKFRKWANDYKWDGEVLDKSSFVKQLQKEKYFVKHTTARYGLRFGKAYVLDLWSMRHLDGVEEIINPGGLESVTKPKEIKPVPKPEPKSEQEPELNPEVKAQIERFLKEDAEASGQGTVTEDDF